MGEKWSALSGAVSRSSIPDRAPKERYFDPDFYELEAELLWPRVWQMACRLEEIPEPGDFVEYEILDQSVIVLRTDDMGVRAFQNACRHRGVKVVEGRGTCDERVHLPVPRVVLRPGRQEHPRPAAADLRRAQPAARRRRPHARCGARRGARARGSTSTTTRRRCGSASSRPPPSSTRWKVESLRTEWWYACRLPVNWKLAQQAFQEQYHVVRGPPAARHPRHAVLGPRRRGVRPPGVRRRRAPVPAHDERGHGRDGPRRRRAHRRGPARHRAARRPGAGDVDLVPHAQRRGRGLAPRRRAATSPTSTSSRRTGINEPMGYCFPHYFVLPMYSSASSYRFRPLGPEETLMEIWSLTRFPEGSEPGQPTPPEVWERDDPRWPPIPAQDFSNLPRQQRGLHAKGFEYMRLSEKAEGHLVEPRAGRRRLPRRPSPRAAAPGPAGGQREPPRAADRRHRPLTAALGGRPCG